MSEQIEIEVGVNTSNFQKAVQGIQQSLRGLSNQTSRIKVDGINTGLKQLTNSSRANEKSFLTLGEAIGKIGKIRVSPKSLKDMQEITKEFLRIVKELGPVITLAMNALDRPLQKAVLSMVKLLTEVERANSNFLVLRKVLPIRLFNALSVNSQRLATAISGVTNDFKNYGNIATKALKRSKDEVIKLYGSLQVGVAQGKKFTEAIAGQKLSKANEVFKGLAKSVGVMARRTRDAVVSATANNRALIKSSNVARILTAEFNALGTGFMQVARKSAGFASSIKAVTTQSSAVNRGLKILSMGGVTLAFAGFKALTTSASLLVIGLGKLSGLGVRKSFTGISAGARVAKDAVVGLTGAIGKVSVAPITLITRGFSSLTSSLASGVATITTTIGLISSLGFTLARVASGSVATYRKEWIKVTSEIPQQNKQATDQLKDQLQDLQVELGLLSKDALPALQRALQIGFSGGASIDVVRQSANLALSEILSLEQAVNLTGETMRVFASSNITAEQTVDKLYKTAKIGGVNLEELASAIKRTGPEIEKTGLSFDDFTASLAMLVRSGRLTYSALQDIENLTKAIINPSEESAKKFEELGVAFGRSALNARGLMGVLTDISVASDGNAETAKALLGSQENLNTALTIGQRQGQAFAKALMQIANSVGSAKKQADELDTTFQRTLRRARATAELLMVDLGELMSPAIESLNEFIKEYTSKIKRVVRLGMELFKQGDLGEFLRLSIAVGLDKAQVKFMNFAQKSASALYNAYNEALTQVGNLAPDLGTSLVGAWLYLQKGFASSLSTMLQMGSIFTSNFFTIFIKGIEEAKEKWNNFFGDGTFNARDYTVILKQQLDESSTRAIGKVFEGLAGVYENAINEAFDSDFAGKIKPALEAVASAAQKTFDATRGTAKESEETSKNIEKMTAMLAKASKNLQDSENKTETLSKEIANSNKLMSVQGTGNDVNGGGGGDGGLNFSGGSTIAGALQKIGGGGNVMDSQNTSMKNLLQVNTRQLDALNLISSELGNLGMGEVR